MPLAPPGGEGGEEEEEEGGGRRGALATMRRHMFQGELVHKVREVVTNTTVTLILTLTSSAACLHWGTLYPADGGTITCTGYGKRRCMYGRS